VRRIEPSELTCVATHPFCQTSHPQSFKFHSCRMGRFYFRAAVTLMAFTMFATYSFLRLSAKNYPGGEAMAHLHYLEGKNVTRGLRPYVHIDVAAAQQGVSRFLEMPPLWRYSKREGPHDMMAYTHLISENATVPGFTPIIRIMGINYAAMMDAARGTRRPDLDVVKMRVFKRTDLDVPPPRDARSSDDGRREGKSLVGGRELQEPGSDEL
jgi:hypothetical protein